MYLFVDKNENQINGKRKEPSSASQSTFVLFDNCSPDWAVGVKLPVIGQILPAARPLIGQKTRADLIRQKLKMWWNSLDTIQ